MIDYYYAIDREGDAMYNPQLKTFLAVADAGSFNKAAVQQYITAPALMKQVNLLERHLGVTLFERTHRGLVLTEAGKALYQDAKRIIRSCDAATRRIQEIAARNRQTIRVGFSPLTPADILVEPLPRIQKQHPGLQVQMIPFVNNSANAIDILSHLGQEIDIVMGIFGENTLDLRQCSGIELFREPFCCAVPTSHRLAGKAVLTIQDLYGEDLMLIHRGWSRQTDILRNDLSRHSQIHVVTFDSFELDVFNQCVNNGAVLVAVSSWGNIHPQLKITPVDWTYSIPFGLLHAPEPTAPVLQFIEAVREATI